MKNNRHMSAHKRRDMTGLFLDVFLYGYGDFEKTPNYKGRRQVYPEIPAIIRKGTGHPAQAN